MAALAVHARRTWPPAAATVVVYNPGVVPAPGYFASGAADYVVVFEAAERQWPCRLAEHLGAIDGARAKAVAVVHSSDAAAAAAAVLAHTRTLGLAGVFVTDQPDGGYTHWPAAWMDFAAAVAQC